MKLTPKLDLTVMGDYQYEKLRSRDNFSEELRWMGYDKYKEEINRDDIRANYELSEYGLPRNGRRHEANLGFNFHFRPAEWLSLTAGARYTRFSINDDGRILQEGVDKWGWPLRMNRGVYYGLTRVATQKEYNTYLRALEEQKKGTGNYETKDIRRISIEKGIPYIDRDWVLNNNNHDHDTAKTLPTFYWSKNGSGRLNIADNPDRKSTRLNSSHW